MRLSVDTIVKTAISRVPQTVAPLVKVTEEIGEAGSANGGPGQAPGTPGVTGGDAETSNAADGLGKAGGGEDDDDYYEDYDVMELGEVSAGPSKLKRKRANAADRGRRARTAQVAQDLNGVPMMGGAGYLHQMTQALGSMLDKKLEHTLDQKLNSLGAQFGVGMAQMKNDILMGHEEAIRKTNVEIAAVKRMQLEQGEKNDAEIKDLQQTTRRLMENFNMLSKKLNDTTSRMKVTATIQVGEATANKRQIAVRGLRMKPLTGKTEQENNDILTGDAETFCVRARELMPKLRDLERMPPGMGLSDTSMEKTITRTQRLGGETGPLMVYFKCDRDAQLIMNTGEGYKEEFKRRIRQYRQDRAHLKANGGNEYAAALPDVIWLDPPMQKPIREEFNRLVRKATQANARIKEGLAPPNTPEIRVHRQRMKLMQDGRSEYETYGLVRELGVDMDSYSPEKKRPRSRNDMRDTTNRQGTGGRDRSMSSQDGMNQVASLGPPPIATDPRTAPFPLREAAQPQSSARSLIQNIQHNTMYQQGAVKSVQEAYAAMQKAHQTQRQQPPTHGGGGYMRGAATGIARQNRGGGYGGDQDAEYSWTHAPDEGNLY